MLRSAFVCWLILGTHCVWGAEPSPADLEFFEKKIRPVLVEQCYACHSAKAAETGKLRGKLVLDTREGALAGGETGPAVVPGKPGDSLLISALKHEDFEMPPKGKLSDAVIADFVKWVELGAPDPRKDKGAVPGSKPPVDIAAGKKFWSFQPLKQVAPPVVNSPWIKTPVDRFILQQQQAAGLTPNGIAEPRLLVRRAYFDLLGLPPTPAEMDQWVAKLMTSTGEFNPQGWSELLDHLLASPHYGERWARHWMDLARFAESHGYEQDYDRPHAYHYRDFLIRAFNKDLPYDQFLQWQIAGDEIAPDQPDAWMATGFLGAGAFPTQLTETEFESSRYDELDDMVATTTVTMLGISLGCARCHDHKFDPLPALDYYRMAAAFTTAIRTEKDFDLHPELNAQRRAEFATKRQQLLQTVADVETQVLPGKFTEWLAQYEPASGATTWEVLDGKLQSSGGSTYVRQPDGSFLAQGAAPRQEVVTFETRAKRTGIVALRIEALADPSLPSQGPGRAPNGNFALGDIQLTARSQGEKAPVTVKWKKALATHQQNDSSLSVAASIDGDPVSGWAIDNQIGKDQAAVFIAETPVELTDLVVSLAFNHPNGQHAMGRMRFSVSNQVPEAAQVGNTGPDAIIVEALQRLKGNTPAENDRAVALNWFKTTLPEWQTSSAAVAELDKQGPQLQLTKVMVTSEGLPHMPHHADGRGFPHFYPETHLLRRGDVTAKVEVVQPGYIQVLMSDQNGPARWHVTPPETEKRASYRRTSLAHWLTDAEAGAGGLAARVMVNRLWQHHFGRGIVATPSDFGAAGERPTHPELLDWLAVELIRGGWKLKNIHKLMMSSSVYLQSSAFDEARAEIDRDNKLLWRRVPQRLEGEVIRDSMLSVAGQLDTTQFGPGTLDQNMKRRSVYFFIKRSQLIPMMMLFDWPEHLVSIGHRSSTTIAPQALLFLNSPQGRQYATALAAKAQAGTPEESIRNAYRLVFARDVKLQELTLATAFLESQTATHQQAGQANPAQLALTDFCQILFGMNEFVFVD